MFSIEYFMQGDNSAKIIRLVKHLSVSSKNYKIEKNSNIKETIGK